MKSNTAKKLVDQTKTFRTAEDERLLKEMRGNKSSDLQKIAERYSKGEIKRETFEKIYQASRDPDKMRQEDYKRFLSVVAKGKLPEKSRYADKFLDALEGGKNEQQEVHEILRSLSTDGEGAMSKAKEKSLLQKLEKAREKDQSQDKTKIRQTEIHDAIANAGKVEHSNWRVDKAPKEVVAKLDEIELQQYELAKEANALDKQLEKEEKKAAPNEKLITKLKSEIASLDEQVDALRAEAAEVEKPWLDYLGKSLNQFRALEQFAQRTGLDLKTIEKIKYWYLTEVSGKKTSKLSGIKIDPTGHAEKQFATLQIRGLHFEPDEDVTKDEPDSPGVLYIDIVDENGKNVSLSYINFIRFVDGTEAYAELNSLEKFNEEMAEEIQYEDLKAGQTYETKVLTEMDESGQKKYSTDQFTIEKIENENGEIKVILDQSVMKTPKNWLSDSIDSRFYFDRKQKVYALGEFAKLLRQHKYKRQVSEGELQKVLDARAKRREKLGYTDNGQLTLPTDAPTNVVFLDDWRRMKKGQLSKDGSDYLLASNDNGLSDGLWNAPLPPEKLPVIESKLPPRIIKKRLSGRDLMESNEKDEIQNEPTEGVTSEDDKPASDKPYKEELLTYDEVHKVGGMPKPEKAFLSGLWSSSRFLSVGDMWEMGKMMWDYYKRRVERRQKDRIGNFGKNLPFFTAEMQRVAQQAETDQVNQFMDAMSQFGVDQIQDRLRNTTNRDELKAALSALTDKGQMKWEDVEFWKNLNRFTDSSVTIPIPEDGDPYRLNEEGRTGMDYIEAAINSLWGQSQYNDWYSKNKTSYTSGMRNFYEEGNELESLQGGHEAKLAQLLENHLEGKYVNPQEYEGLIQHAILQGKASMQGKLYYMVAGVAKRNPNGKTIMSIDRIGHINSEHLNRLPLLDYMTSSMPRQKSKGSSEIERHRPTTADYEAILKIFDGDNDKNVKPNSRVHDFMWKYILSSNEVEKRINKVMTRGADGVDHDDVFAYVPQAGVEILDTICQSSAGSRKFLSLEAYANVFPGFSQYMQTLSANGNKKKLTQAISSYVFYEGIITKRNMKEKGNNYIRFEKRTLEAPTVVGEGSAQMYIDETNGMISQIIEAYSAADGADELKRVAELVYSTPPADPTQPGKPTEDQRKINQAFNDFPKIFEKVIASDDGAKMLDIVQKTKLTGMPYLSKAEQEARKAENPDSGGDDK